MFCPRCGAEHDEGAPFCKRCGTSFAEHPALEAPPEAARVDTDERRKAPSPRTEVITDPLPFKTRIVMFAVLAAIVVAAIALLNAFVIPHSVVIDETTFPDAEVRQAVARQADANGDGKLSRAELSGVESLDLSGLSMDALDGIERFDHLSDLDVSGCVNLRAMPAPLCARLAKLDVKGSGITELDFSKNTTLEALACGDEVVVTGLEGTELRQQWLLSSYVLDGQNGLGDQRYDSDVVHLEMTCEYDASGHLLRKMVSDQRATDPAPYSTVTVYSYDDEGRMTALERSSSSSAANESITLLYDDEGRPTGYTGSSRGALTYEDGRLTSVTYDDYSPTYFTYDAEGRLATVRTGSDSAQAPTTTYAYEKGGRVTSVTWSVGEATTGRVTYTYDTQGRVVARQFNFEMIGEYVDEFIYGESGHLMSATRGDTVYVLNYDKHGNLVSYGDVDGRSAVAYLSYRRAFMPSESAVVAPPLRMGDPLLSVGDADPCDIVLLSDQDPIVAYDGEHFSVV